MTPQELLAHAEFVERLAFRLVRDEHRAADLAQETILAALRYGPRGGPTLRAWLGRVARNLSLKGFRSDRRRTRRERVAAAIDGVPSAETIVEREEIRRPPRARGPRASRIPSKRHPASFLRGASAPAHRPSPGDPSGDGADPGTDRRGAARKTPGRRRSPSARAVALGPDPPRRAPPRRGDRRRGRPRVPLPPRSADHDPEDETPARRGRDRGEPALRPSLHRSSRHRT